MVLPAIPTGLSNLLEHESVCYTGSGNVIRVQDARLALALVV